MIFRLKGITSAVLTTLLVLGATTTSASAENIRFWFNIANLDEVPLTIEILKGKETIHCYEPDPQGLPGTITKIPRYGTYAWYFKMTEGCDIGTGRFGFKVTPWFNRGDGATRDTAQFYFNGDKGFSVRGDVPNQYEGKLIATGTSLFQYQTSGLMKKPVAGAPVEVTTTGAWEFLCGAGANCTITSAQQFSVSKSLAKGWNESVEKAVSGTLGVKTTTGVEVGGDAYGGKVTSSVEISASVTAGLTNAVARSNDSTDTKGTDTSSTIACQKTAPKDKLMYVWKESVSVSNISGSADMKMCLFACSDSGTPTFGQFSKEAITSCAG
jgi:hypothetical protein